MSLGVDKYQYAYTFTAYILLNMIESIHILMEYLYLLLSICSFSPFDELMSLMELGDLLMNITKSEKKFYLIYPSS